MTQILQGTLYHISTLFAFGLCFLVSKTSAAILHEQLVAMLREHIRFVYIITIFMWSPAVYFILFSCLFSFFRLFRDPDNNPLALGIYLATKGFMFATLFIFFWPSILFKILLAIMNDLVFILVELIIIYLFIMRERWNQPVGNHEWSCIYTCWVNYYLFIYNAREMKSTCWQSWMILYLYLLS